MTLKILEGKGRKICVINKVLGDFFWKTGMNAMDEAGVPRLGSIVLRRLMTTPSGQLCFNASHDHRRPDSFVSRVSSCWRPRWREIGWQEDVPRKRKLS
jgi:hypothetical protein